MFKRLLIILFLLSCAPSLWAQSTTVSGQVTDAGGQTWNNGAITVQFVPNPLYPTFPQYSWTGGTLNQTVSGTLSSTGSYSISIPASTSITPVGSTWQIKFCPQASSICFITANTTITGATQTVNATPPAIVVAPGPGATAYADSEIASPIIGSTYYNTTSNQQRICNGPALPCSWGSSGGTAPNGAGIPSYNGPNIFYAANFASSGNGPLGKGMRFFDGSWTNTHTVTVGNNTNDHDPCVTSAQIGWLVAGTNGQATTPSQTATNEFGYPATITAVASCTSFTISNNTSAGCTSSPGTSACQVVMAPYDDYPAVNAAWTALVNAMGSTGGITSCAGAKLVLPQGLIWLSQPPRSSMNCNTDVESNGSTTGYYVEGAGPYSTTIFPAPSGLWTVGANQGTLFYNTGTGNGKGAHFANFSVDGAGQYAPFGSSGYMFSLNQNSSASYVNVYTIGINAFNCAGGDAAEAILDHVNAGGDTVGVNMGNYCKSSFSAYFWGTAATAGSAVMGGGPVWSENDSFDFNSNTNGANLLCNAGEVWVDHALVMSNSVNNPLVNATNGCKIHLSHSLIQNCLNGTNGVGLNIDATPSFIYLLDTRVTCTATNAKALNNLGTLYDLGGNVFQTTIANTPGTYIGQASTTFNQTIVTAAKTVLSAGWGNGPATSTALSGGNSPIGFTITNTGAAQGASPTITYTFPIPYMVTPLSCTATQTGGTNASLNPFATSALTATGATFTATGTPTAAATEIMQVTCVTP